MNFVKELSTGQTSILDGQVLKQDPESLAKQWADEFTQDTMVGDVMRCGVGYVASDSDVGWGMWRVTAA